MYHVNTKSRLTPRVGGAVLIALSLILVACEKQSQSNNSDYVSTIEIQDFLKAQYFEIPENVQHINNFSFQLLDGSQGHINSSSDKVIFLNFWAVWCLPCKKEMPDIESLHRLMKDEEFRILAVNLGDKTYKVRKFADRFSYTFDIIVDEKKVAATKFKIMGLPTTIILSKGGRVLGRVMGPKNWDDPIFIDFLTKISRN